MTINLKPLKAEYKKLEAELSEQRRQLEIVQTDLQPLKDVRYWVSKVIKPEQHPTEKKSEPIHSVIDKLKYSGAVAKAAQEEQKQEQNNRKRRDQEL